MRKASAFVRDDEGDEWVEFSKKVLQHQLMLNHVCIGLRE